MYHIEDYIKYSKNKGLTTSTIKTRYRALRKFEKYLNDKSIIDIMKVTSKELNDYVQFLLKEKSIYIKKIRSINSTRDLIFEVLHYFKFLYDNSYILYNPGEKVDVPKKAKYLPRGILTEKEMKKILNLTHTNTYQGCLEKLIIEILYSTGIRNKELINIDMYDIDFEEQTVTIVEGKGRKDRKIPIGKNVLLLIDEYLKKYRPEVLKYSERSELLLSSEGKKLKGEYVCKVMKYYTKLAGIRKKITPHSIRHTFAVHMLKNGADIFAIKEILGHTNLLTTQIYLKVYDQDIKNMQNQSHPREWMKVNEI